MTPPLSRRTLLHVAAAVAAAPPAFARPPESWTLTLPGFDGAPIAYRSIGIGRPLVLLHGFLSNSEQNWIAPGLAERLARTGRRVIAADFRGHGRSAAPTDPAAYPPDALAMDIEALLAGLEIEAFDIAGYSLGARIAARLAARGRTPGRMALCGMGASGLTSVAGRQAYFEDAIRNGEAAANPQVGRFVRRVLEANGMLPDAALGALGSQVDTPAEALSAMAFPVLVLAGERDSDNGSAEELAGLFPNARAARTPGDHLTAFTTPEFADALAAFFNA